MQNDKDHPSISPDPAQEATTKHPADEVKPGGKRKAKVEPPMPDGSSEEALLEKTGESQGQSKGRGQTQPQE